MKVNVSYSLFCLRPNPVPCPGSHRVQGLGQHWFSWANLRNQSGTSTVVWEVHMCLGSWTLIFSIFIIIKLSFYSMKSHCNNKLHFVFECLLSVRDYLSVRYVLSLIFTSLHRGPWTLGQKMWEICSISGHCFHNFCLKLYNVATHCEQIASLLFNSSRWLQN